jgi:hypothetical protein
MVGRAEPLLHARVPVIKFHSANGHIECDLKLADPETLFKCRFLELLTKIDGRLGRLYYLVGAWAVCLLAVMICLLGCWVAGWVGG